VSDFTRRKMFVFDDQAVMTSREKKQKQPHAIWKRMTA